MQTFWQMRRFSVKSVWKTIMKAIADRWEYDMSGIDAVYLQGSDVLYTASGYFDAVNEARAKDKYLTFCAIYRNRGAETTQNRPYRVKQVLEDNLLGEAIAFG